MPTSSQESVEVPLLISPTCPPPTLYQRHPNYYLQPPYLSVARTIGSKMLTLLVDSRLHWVRPLGTTLEVSATVARVSSTVSDLSGHSCKCRRHFSDMLQILPEVSVTVIPVSAMLPKSIVDWSETSQNVSPTFPTHRNSYGSVAVCPQLPRILPTVPICRHTF